MINKITQCKINYYFKSGLDYGEISSLIGNHLAVVDCLHKFGYTIHTKNNKLKNINNFERKIINGVVCYEEKET